MFAKVLGDNARERYLVAAIGFLAFLFPWITYLKTVQPTVSFWDCGEFIACSTILGVPHPPGAPLFLLIGRLVALFPFPMTIAHKINALSSTFGALTLIPLYLASVYFIRQWFGKDRPWAGEVMAQVGGLASAWIVGFSGTYWSNCIEAEVYAPAMFLNTLCCWLAIVWMSDYKNPQANRLILLIVLLTYLGIGIHLTTMIFLPAFIIFTVIVDERKRKDWAWYLTGLILFSVSFGFKPFIAILGLGTLAFSLASFANPRYRLNAMLCWLAVIAFSVFLVVTIRSRQNPDIDENDPGTVESFSNYMDRKQYGQESLWTLMLTRKGTFANQLGTHSRMGFWGFFREQYGGDSPNLLQKIGIRYDNRNLNGAIFLFLAFLGMYWLMLNEFKGWSIYFLLALAGTIGLLLYLNFSDGTKGPGLEVRDRDYFYTPGFIFMGYFMGLGLAALGYWAFRIFKGTTPGQVAVVVISAIALLLPINSRAVHYFHSDRSRNYTPEDYGKNILSSCEDGSILFTNGDNDTFPLWFLQEVLGFKKSVRIANLSLLNTNWYIHQLKNQMGIKISFTDQEIDSLRAGYIQRDGKRELIKVQDLMVFDIVSENMKLCPIYMALTVSGDAKTAYTSEKEGFQKIDLSPFLAIEGLVYHFIPKDLSSYYKSPYGYLDPEKSFHNVVELYNYRSLNDTTIYQDENTAKLLQNYTTGFLNLSNYFQDSGDPNRARMVMEKWYEVMPYEWRGYPTLFEIYTNMGQTDKATAIVEKFLTLPNDKLEDARPMVYFWQILSRAKNMELAGRVAKEAIRRYPEDKYVQAYINQMKDQSGGVAQ